MEILLAANELQTNKLGHAIAFECVTPRNRSHRRNPEARGFGATFGNIRSQTMQINLTGHHVDITEALKGYVDSKFERLARHFDNVLAIHVVLSVEKLRQKAEATLHVNGAKVFADSVHEDMYAAIDALVDKLDRQVLKHKEKKSDHRANGHKGLDKDLETA
jgi:putative sigma-54 modulation protein